VRDGHDFGTIACTNTKVRALMSEMDILASLVAEIRRDTTLRTVI
jgi:hypothetical protein